MENFFYWHSHSHTLAHTFTLKKKKSYWAGKSRFLFLYNFLREKGRSLVVKRQKFHTHVHLWKQIWLGNHALETLRHVHIFDHWKTFFALRIFLQNWTEKKKNFFNSNLNLTTRDSTTNCGKTVSLLAHRDGSRGTVGREGERERERVSEESVSMRKITGYPPNIPSLCKK